MKTIRLEKIDDELKVTTPYNADFVAKCRNLRGKFRDGAWWFDDSIIEYVREAMISVYGTTGEDDYEECSLLIKNFSDRASCASVTLFGRTIARACGRDSGARLGDGIILISGSVDSGGSVKNWLTCVDDATFEIQHFPLPSTEKEDVQKAIKDGMCEIKQCKKKIDKEAVKQEIEKLYKRIHELEKLIENE